MIERILFNGNIYTQHADQPNVTALAISGGRIVAYGLDEDILPLATAGTIQQNLDKQTVIPGLTDAHIHWQWTARSLSEVDVFEVPTRHHAVQRVAERVATTPQGEWITGYGWSQEFWPDKSFPTADILDAVSPEHPVYLRSKSAHAVWVNSAALRSAGITADTPDPVGGKIGRDESGQPNGILFETAAQMVFDYVTHPTDEHIADQMRDLQKLALASGLTGVHDFDGPRCFSALQLLHGRGDLHLRVVKNINAPYIHHAHELGLHSGFGDDFLRLGGLKIFADGALGPRTALMIAPYEGEPHNNGMRVTAQDEMYALVSRASLAGFPSTIHAIGDLAVREVLDVYQAVRADEAKVGIKPDQRRHRIEHLQIIHPDDVNRLAELNIIASMQPIHATSDWHMADRYWGAERCELAYNPLAQIQRGVVVAFGSDSPIDPFDPLPNIYAAVTRRRPDGSPGAAGWYPQNKISVEAAVRGFTIGPAYAAGMEDRLGRLINGYLADLVVLDRDIFTISADELLDVEVMATMVGGVWRYEGIS
ncbi:MAG: amidohydrolase [Anaerolineaceae bacterium]|nr:MAG: amidohydrolase [Anaerolineaceae bacterium]